MKRINLTEIAEMRKTPISQIDTCGQIPKEKTVVFYCRKGIRSQIAIQRLQDRFGFTNLLNLKGGIGEGP